MGERCKHPKRDLVHFRFNIWHLIAAILMTFLVWKTEVEKYSLYIQFLWVIILWVSTTPDTPVPASLEIIQVMQWCQYQPITMVWSPAYYSGVGTSLERHIAVLLPRVWLLLGRKCFEVQAESTTSSMWLYDIIDVTYITTTTDHTTTTSTTTTTTTLLVYYYSTMLPVYYESTVTVAPGSSMSST